jgi:hypothetical protein
MNFVTHFDPTSVQSILAIDTIKRKVQRQKTALLKFEPFFWNFYRSLNRQVLPIKFVRQGYGVIGM